MGLLMPQAGHPPIVQWPEICSPLILISLEAALATGVRCFWIPRRTPLAQDGRPLRRLPPRRWKCLRLRAHLAMTCSAQSARSPVRRRHRLPQHRERRSSAPPAPETDPGSGDASHAMQRRRLVYPPVYSGDAFRSGSAMDASTAARFSPSPEPCRIRPLGRPSVAASYVRVRRRLVQDSAQN